MKLKRVLSLLVGLVLVMALYPVTAFSAQPQIQYTMMLNAERYTYNPELVKRGDSIEMAVENVMVDGEPASADKVSYQWSESFTDPSRPGLMFREITGATQNTYTVDSYAGAAQYMCDITVEGGSRVACSFSFVEDTLTLAGSANQACTYNEEEDQWEIEELSVGDAVTLTVTPQSTLGNPTYTYSWTGGTVYIPPDGTSQGVVENQPGNTLTVEKFTGEQRYTCRVSDGNTTKYIYFVLFPKETITSGITVNGKVPGTYAGTYVFVTNPGEEVKVEIPASTTGGNLNYSWYYTNDVTPIHKITETGNTITHMKSTITENDPYAWEVFECYVEDGNDRIRYWLMLFCLDPETPLAEAKKIGASTPNVSIQTSDTDLANSALDGTDLNNMRIGAPTEIILTTEKKDTVADAEKQAIDNKLGDNSKVGMYLDMNLFKDVAGEQTQITETNSEIRLSIDLPETLLNQDAKVTRTYQIIRMHNGVAEALDCTLDQETNKLTFDTDKFSTYTVVYTDTVVAEETPPANTTNPTDATEATDPADITNPTNPTEATDPADTTEATNPPKTGDEYPVALLTVTSLFSLCAVLILLFRRKFV